MDYITITGLTAGALTTVSFLPQVIKAWKTKSTGDLSLGTFVLQGSAVSLWIIYGFIAGKPPIILWNLATALLVLIIIILKLKYK